MEQKSMCAFCGRTFSSDRAREAHKKKTNHSITMPKSPATIDTKKLREGSPELAKIIEELEEFRREHERNPTTLSYHVTPGQIKAIAAQFLARQVKIEGAKAIMQKFVTKCETGRARSVETYAEMTAWLATWQGDPDER